MISKNGNRIKSFSSRSFSNKIVQIDVTKLNVENEFVNIFWETFSFSILCIKNSIFVLSYVVFLGADVTLKHESNKWTQEFHFRVSSASMR